MNLEITEPFGPGAGRAVAGPAVPVTVDAHPAHEFWPAIQAQAGAIFLTALALGIGLRLIAAIWGDIGPGGDGAERLALAIGWAEAPKWEGLTGVWPHAHWYILGALIRVWNQPVILARMVNLFCGVAAIVALRQTVRQLFDEWTASVSALILAIFWTHIWLTSAYWVEPPFLLLIILAVGFSVKAKDSGKHSAAILSGLFLALAILLRHEGMVLFGLFLVWYGFRIRKPRMILAFLVLPAMVCAWNFIEPWLAGHSYFEYANFVREAKAGENLVQGFTQLDCLKQWVLMPAGVPSIVVVLPGFYGLWRARKIARYELFAWMFVAQLGFYFSMTLVSSWRPQLRYVMVYFINLIPYAAYGWLEIVRALSARRWVPARAVLIGLVALTILTQSVAWWVGRNNRRPMGWLPIEIRTSSQKAVDDWLAKIVRDSDKQLNIVAILPGLATAPWSLKHSAIVDGLRDDRVDTKIVYVPEQKEVMRGELPPAVRSADIVLIYPGAVFYDTVRTALRAEKPDWSSARIHPDIEVLSGPR